MGPWSYLLPYSQPTSGGTGDIDFGPEAAYPLLQMQLEWSHHYVRDGSTSLPRPPVTLFVMGDNVWRHEDEWPLNRAQASFWYLHSKGDANSAGGGGTLDSDRSDPDELPDTYVYAPEDPVPPPVGGMSGPACATSARRQADRTSCTTPRLRSTRTWRSLAPCG